MPVFPAVPGTCAMLAPLPCPIPCLLSLGLGVGVESWVALISRAQCDKAVKKSHHLSSIGGCKSQTQQANMFLSNASKAVNVTNSMQDVPLQQEFVCCICW